MASMPFRLLLLLPVLPLSVYVTSVVTDASDHEWWLLGGGLLSLLSSLIAFGVPPVSSLRLLFPPLVSATVAWLLNTLDVYAISFLVSPLILFFVHVLEDLQWSTYATRSASFVYTRMTSYALLRCLSTFLWEQVPSLPSRLVLLVPFAVSSVETAGMVILQSSSYTFDRVEFLYYATTKAAVFLSLPLLEATLISRLLF